MTREHQAATSSANSNWWQRWNSIPLYFRILLALVAGSICGLLLGENARVMEIPAKVILQLLGAIAPPLILVAVTHVLMNSEVPKRSVGRLAWLLILNTTVAILIGLLVANTIQPGKHSHLPPPKPKDPQAETKLNPV